MSYNSKSLPYCIYPYIAFNLLWTKHSIFLKRSTVLLWKCFFVCLFVLCVFFFFADVYVDSLEGALNFCVYLWCFCIAMKRQRKSSFLVNDLLDFHRIKETIRDLYCSIFVHGESPIQWWKNLIKLHIP